MQDLEDDRLNEAPTRPGPTNLHDQVIAELRDLVTRGELVEGKRVPEAALCQRLAISRTPLREALKVLAAEGFIALRPNRGAVVVPIDRAAVAAVFEVKGGLERLIGLLLPERIGRPQLAHLEQLHEQLRSHYQDGGVAAYTRLNHEFHAALAAATRNDALVQVYSGLQQKILRARFAINEQPARIGQSMAEHDGIMVMLRAGAAQDLAHRLEEHNRLTGEAILRQLGETLAEPGAAG
ncbi:FCD domain-containing protein [Aurantimonas aggregata]|uniref:FCD domain-containing protein n=1 Tax=Aurantimonas aggregata TaxID=2047720 RepID=A0A6L9MJ79_9HYPH|nr:GntR family transcriptional regulator [Aurantimonas aggregata]NDV87672.1 FCD domain-containing protein [Aurantimonas aggregata]